MESFSFEQTPQLESEVNTVEKKLELGQKIAALHERYTSRLPAIEKEEQALRRKYADVLRQAKSPWTMKEGEFMNLEDLRRYDELEAEKKVFDHQIAETFKEALDLLSQDPEADWKRMPLSGAPGSLTFSYYREYMTKIDNNYGLRIVWRNFPDDESQVGDPSSFRERFTGSLVGSKDIRLKSDKRNWFGRKKEILREDDEFPINSFGVYANEKGEFQSSSELQSFFETRETEKLKEELLQLGKRLHNQLG